MRCEMWTKHWALFHGPTKPDQYFSARIHFYSYFYVTYRFWRFYKSKKISVWKLQLTKSTVGSNKKKHDNLFRRRMKYWIYFATCFNKKKKLLIVSHFHNHRCQTHFSLPVSHTNNDALSLILLDENTEYIRMFHSDHS